MGLLDWALRFLFCFSCFVLDTARAEEVQPFDSFFDKTCKQPFDAARLVREYNQTKLCEGKWIDFSAYFKGASYGLGKDGNGGEIQIFEDYSPEDFEMPRPRHLKKVNGRWETETGKAFFGDEIGETETGKEEHIQIPNRICVLEVQGYFDSTGALMDCDLKEYPLLMPKDRSDISIVKSRASINALQSAISGNSAAAKSASATATPHPGPLYSLVVPYNDAFGHSFTTGVSMLAFIYPMLANDPTSRVLAPQSGPLRGLLRLLGISSSRIVVAHKGDSVSHHYSPKATLLLREGPFNVVQSHWPRGSLSSLHRLTLHKLREVGLLDIGIAASASTSNSNPSSNSNENKKEKGKTAQPKLVVYLSRPKGERSLYQEDLLINLMRGMLKPGFVLEVVGKGEKKISYYTDQQKLLDQEAKLKELEESGAEVTTLQAVNNSTADTAETAWLSRAHLYARATAVVGVHGGAMANCAFLCPPNTTVIEINVPWIPALQDDNGESALARAASAVRKQTTKQYSPSGRADEYRPPTRDAFYSTFWNLGLRDYYNVHPLSVSSGLGDVVRENLPFLYVLSPQQQVYAQKKIRRRARKQREQGISSSSFKDPDFAAFVDFYRGYDVRIHFEEVLQILHLKGVVDYDQDKVHKITFQYTHEHKGAAHTAKGKRSGSSVGTGDSDEGKKAAGARGNTGFLQAKDGSPNVVLFRDGDVDTSKHRHQAFTRNSTTAAAGSKGRRGGRDSLKDPVAHRLRVASKDKDEG